MPSFFRPCPFLIPAMLLLSALSVRAAQKVIPGPAGSRAFGTRITVLPNGNIVVTDPLYEEAGNPGRHGAVYLYNGVTLEVISVLKGVTGNDTATGAGVRVLPGGDFLILSPDWREGRGAVTWGSGTSGVSGDVSAVNSLVGTDTGDAVGGEGITVLANGNYVVRCPFWNDRRGAATWGHGASGVSGEVSAANSLVGSAAGERVGHAVETLPNGHYVVRSPYWNETRGAVTWGSGTEGVAGPVSPANSLVGGAVNEHVGGRHLEAGVVPLPGGNFVVVTPGWKENRGAVTWASGTAGVKGEISAANSLVGGRAGDEVGGDWFTILTNGNYVAPCPRWNENRGAVVWASGTSGITGEVSEANALVGGRANDRVGTAVTALTNGNYVVGSHRWNENRGALTWGHGATGITGTVSAANSLVGSRPDDRVGDFYGVTALTNGNYVLVSSEWNDGRGAVTWGSGTEGITGEISPENSLVGGESGDLLGANGVRPLANGNYLVLSPFWSTDRGAVTWASGTTGIKGMVSASNSLTGGSVNDRVGVGAVELANGNYVVGSRNWNGKRGAVTLGSGISGVVGTVSASNSLVGTQENDKIGGNGTIPVGDGNCLVRSYDWNQHLGALTWVSGTAGLKGEVSASNSLIGAVADELQESGFSRLANGNYVLNCPGLNGGRGAVIWQNGNAGSTGPLSSLEAGVLKGDGSSPYGLGLGSGSVHTLSNGNYLVNDPGWNGKQGAVIWGSGTTGVSGFLTAANSVTRVPEWTRIHILDDGNYLVLADHWPAGALVLGNGAKGTAGAVSTANAVVGSSLRQAPTGFIWRYDAPRSRLVTGYAPGNWLSLLDLTPPPAAGPKISVSANGREIAHGDTTPSLEDHTDFGGVAYFQKKARRFTIRNTGTAPLNLPDRGISLPLPDSGNPSFSVTMPPEKVVPPGGSTTFEITYAPLGANHNEALLSILSDDAEQGFWSFALAGRMLSPLQGWRETHFGDATDNVGDLDDFDHDGVSNILEFSFGTLPGDRTSGPEPLSYSGPLTGGGTVARAGMPAVLTERTGDKVEIRAVWCRRSDQAARCTPQFSGDLKQWLDIHLAPTVLADDGNAQIVGLPFPDMGQGRAGYFRLKVDSPE